jgi:hypothetical protein
MGIIKRILIIFFGLLSGVTGFLSLLVSIALAAASFSGTGPIIGRIYIAVWMLLISEVLFAFGVSSSLLSLRCFFGPKDWIKKMIDYSWGKAMKIALILPAISLASVLIYWLIKLFIS